MYQVSVKRDGKRKRIGKYFRLKNVARIYAEQYNLKHKGADAKVVNAEEPKRSRYTGYSTGDNY